jgi:hypothetical protein
MSQPNTRKTDRFSILLAGITVAIFAAGPALSGGNPNKPPDPEPPPPPVTCDGLNNDFDLDQDGLPDLMDCEGLATISGAAFDYPGCISTPTSAPNCTNHTVADLFAEVHRDTTSRPLDGSAYEELGISDDEVFSFAESSLALNVHVLPEGTLGAGRVVIIDPNRPQAGVILNEDRSLGAASCPSTPQTTGISYLSNPNEFGVFDVLTQRIIDKIDCIGGTTEQKRQHTLNTSSHELGHGGLRQAPDPASYHQETLGSCVMEASIEPGRRNRLTIPTTFCSTSQETILLGVTSQGPTICGDVTTYDGDPTFECLPKSAP